MTFNFVERVMCIGSGSPSPILQFYKKGFNLGNGSIEPTWQDIILHGNTALTLANAKADSLEYLKLFGGTEQRNLPSEYTQVKYVSNTASAVVNTGIMLDFNNNYEFEIECRAVVGSWYLFQSRETSSGPSTGLTGSTSGSTIILNIDGTAVCTSAITRTEGNILYIKATFNNGTATLYIKNKTAGVEDTQTNSYVTTSNPTSPMCLFGNLADQFIRSNSNIYFARIKENGNYIMDYVSCRQNTTAGFYDKVSDTFKTTTNLSAGADVVPTPDSPMDIVCNNGVVKVSKNLFDKEQTYIPAFVNANTGVLSEPAGGRQRSFVVDCLPNTTYTLSGMTAASGWGSFTSPTIGTTATNFTAGNGTITTGANDKYLIGMAYVESDTSYDYRDTLQIEQGSTPTSYMPYGQIYVDGTTETVEIAWNNLLDTTSIITGQRLSNVLGLTYGGNSGSTNDFARDTSYYVSNLIPVEVGKTYIKNSPSADAYHRFKVYDSNRVGVRITNDNSIAIQSGEAYIAFCGLQTELTTAYCGEVTYTATAQPLYKVGTYQDVQSVIDGGVTHRCGIKVFDGTENWNVENQTRMIYSTTVINSLKSSSNFGLTSSHYIPTTEFNASMPDNSIKLNTLGYVFIRMTGCANTNELKQFLANQYAQGTPVTILYPLATPTTEAVTAQPMNIQAGTNIVQITQASMDDLELEVKYKAGVSVTITEIQNAQLDDNVEVTING